MFLTSHRHRGTQRKKNCTVICKVCIPKKKKPRKPRVVRRRVVNVNGPLNKINVSAPQGPAGPAGPPGPQGPQGPPGTSEAIGILPIVQRYFFIVESDIVLQEPVVIPASEFTNDAGEPVEEFTGLGQNSYNNLFINGILQEANLYTLRTNSITLLPSTGTIYAGTPIICETVSLFAYKIP